MEAAFFDILKGRTFDKLYIHIPEKGGQEIFLTFDTDETIKISCSTEMNVTFKDKDQNIIPLKYK